MRKFYSPTKEYVRKAIKAGWNEDEAKRGYNIFENYWGILEIERIDVCYLGSKHEMDDSDCAREAERSGFCKIIPIDELPKALGDHRYCGYVDTPENRDKLNKLADFIETA